MIVVTASLRIFNYPSLPTKLPGSADIWFDTAVLWVIVAPKLKSACFLFIMPIQIVFETHSISEDNETGHASGCRHSRLSPRGCVLAGELGARRRNDGLAAVFASDLGRARETAEVAFPDGIVPILQDWRLRECDYGLRNGMPAEELHQNRGSD